MNKHLAIVTLGYALESSADFLSEKRNEVYKWYSEASIAGEKCAGGQEFPQRSQLCWMADGKGA